MSGPGFEEHWFDRLAAPQTRRQVLKAALAGVALTVPFVRVASARADPDPKCFDGCDWSNHLRYEEETRGCESGLNTGMLSSTAVTFYANPVFGAAAYGVTFIKYVNCRNQALLGQKARAFDCLQPGCPGFDAHDKRYGPCRDCDAANGGKGFACCPSTNNLSGFVCCVCCDLDSGYGCKALCGP